MVEKYPVVAVCRDLEELKSLALPDPTREFTLMGIQGFEFHDVLENKTYEIGVDDLKIPVTTKEVLDFYPAEHRLKVVFPEQWLEKVPEQLRDGLTEVLAQDPRPSYQHDPERVYGLSFSGWEIKFRVEGVRLYVLALS